MRRPVAVAFAVFIAWALLPALTATAVEPTPEDIFGVPCDDVGLAGQPLDRGFNCRTIEIEGYPRLYIVYVPHNSDFNLNRKAPVVLGQHGSGGTGGNFIKTSGWIARAEREGILLAFGTALEASVIAEGGHIETRWNAIGMDEQIDLDIKPIGYPAEASWPPDDVGFISAVLDDLDDTAKVDDRHVFATGFSNGAGFTVRLGIELSDRIAAMTGFGGSLGSIVVAVNDPIPYFLGWGDNDRHLAPPELRPIPLDPLAWIGYPNWLTVIATTTASWGVGAPDRIVQNSAMTRLEWDINRVPLYIALLAGVGHEYPDGADRVSWRFFENSVH